MYGITEDSAVDSGFVDLSGSMERLKLIVIIFYKSVKQWSRADPENHRMYGKVVYSHFNTYLLTLRTIKELIISNGEILW